MLSFPIFPSLDPYTLHAHVCFTWSLEKLLTFH